MAIAALPMIPRKYVDPKTGRVNVWDLSTETDPPGPVKIEMTGILAREALQRDPERFKLELPRGVKPGPAQEEAERLAADRADPGPQETTDPAYGRRS